MADASDAPAAARGLTSGFPLPILALTLSAFATGTAEFVIAGLPPDIARDLDVTIPGAGRLRQARQPTVGSLTL